MEAVLLASILFSLRLSTSQQAPPRELNEKRTFRRLRQRLFGARKLDLPSPTVSPGAPQRWMDWLVGSLELSRAAPITRGVVYWFAAATSIHRFTSVSARIQPRGLRNHRLSVPDQRGQDQHRHSYGAGHGRSAGARSRVTTNSLSFRRTRISPRYCESYAAGIGAPPFWPSGFPRRPTARRLTF